MIKPAREKLVQGLGGGVPYADDMQGRFSTP